MLRFSLAAVIFPLAVLAQDTAPSPQPKPTTVTAAAKTPVKPAPHEAEAPLPVATATPVPSTPSAPNAPKLTYSQCHVDGPYIAMTFDDGPHPTQTPRLLEMLKQRGIKATFYCVGECVAEYPEIAKRIVEEGHEIANHSW